MRAREDNRITSGVFDCANKLEQEPESVMLCLLPGGTSDDISVAIQHTLIEAYCWENDINVIKVCTLSIHLKSQNLYLTVEMHILRMLKCMRFLKKFALDEHV